MKPSIKYLLLLLIIIASSSISKSQIPNEKESDVKAIWQKIGPFFSPPEEYKGYGDYRSPLKFYNGQSVRNKEDWIKRRKEILECWNKMMGEWPPFIRNQEMEILETIHKDG
jgi:hypothetical protein